VEVARSMTATNQGDFEARRTQEIRARSRAAAITFNSNDRMAAAQCADETSNDAYGFTSRSQFKK